MRRRLADRFRRHYGASSMHLVVHLVGFAVVAVALNLSLSGGSMKQLLLLYFGVVIAHDLAFVPAYSALDRLVRATARLPRAEGSAVPVVNHIRAPAAISALLLIIYLPLISGQSDNAYFSLTDRHLTHYLRNWLSITALLFLSSALIYAIRVLRARTASAG